jgi:DNA-binding XRE family transcriptional regulator
MSYHGTNSDNPTRFLKREPSPSIKPNMTRVLRRRLGLTQAELAFLVGYQSDSGQVSRIENGTRMPHLAELLIYELLFGVPAVVFFPQIRDRVGSKMAARARMLLSEIERSSGVERPRISYKAAQLERVVASLTRDGFDAGELDV